MTNDDKIALSKQVAELYGIYAYHHDLMEWFESNEGVLSECKWEMKYLAYDSARVFELAVEYEISIEPWTDCVDVGFYIDEVFSGTWLKENYADHQTKAEATRIAILKCLVKMKEGV